MKYVILNKDDITQQILDEINQDTITNPVIIWSEEPPVDSPGGVDSGFRYIGLNIDYPNSLQGFKKFTEEERDIEITKIQNGKSIVNKIVNTVYQDQDQTGRPVFRPAATIKGWHYQFHSVQFEVNKLNSIYNKDYEGTDLGFAELKIYDSNGNECTTQTSADTSGVKTVLTWKPDFDFEVVAGNIRQLEKETVDSYVYVNAKVNTGLPAPNDKLTVPFVQGGLNLRYIGADETLKTDGRASKLLKGSEGEYFEVIVNYESDLLTNTNRHKMSIVFEIYKHPTT